MNISELPELLSLTVVQGEYADREVTEAYTSDLLSDVMGNASDECVLITIQAHKNTLAVATLKDMGAVIICNNRPVPEDMIEAARSENIGLFLSKESQFVISGKLYRLLSGGAG
jgi:serine kinase of HPr protein (carbohydrate metabolism regulator)